MVHLITTKATSGDTDNILKTLLIRPVDTCEPWKFIHASIILHVVAKQNTLLYIV